MATYNHDLHVSEDFKNQFPRIGDLLSCDFVLKMFDEYDRVARTQKKIFLRCGFTALILGMLALFGSALSLLISGLAAKSPHWMHVLFEMMAVASFGILLTLKCFGVRRRYLQACFARERIRHWHFQSFLDGELTEKRQSADTSIMAAADAEYRRRWTTFCERLRILDSAINDYVERPHIASELLHTHTPYTDAGILGEVLESLYLLRIEHQAGYTQRRLAEEQEDHTLSLADHFEWSEFVARFSLVLAVAIPATSLLFSMIHTSSSQVLFTSLAFASIFLMIVSTAARAYQTGFTVPAEIHSYREYLAEIDSIRIRSTSTSDASTKLKLLAELECTAAIELRRFLSIKRRASFII